MQQKRVVITGLGVISGIGKTVQEVWQNVVQCQSGIGPIQSMDMSNIRFKNGCALKGYQPLEHFSQKELDVIDPFAQVAVIAAREAVKDAGIEWTDELRQRTGIITGTSIGGEQTQDDSFKELYQLNKNRVALFTIPRIMPNAAASHISMEMGITGLAYTISTACASSNHAMGNAFWMIRSGMCDMAITGGSEMPLNFGFLKAWEAIRVVAPDTCRPFSKGRQGMILGEGGAMLVFESLENALNRNAKIYAEVIGFGMSSDASHITKPSQAGPETAIQLALKDASLAPDEVDYINAHGTGTLVNDATEAAAIQKVFGPHAKDMAVSSTKSLHGHVLGGTSAIEAVITALSLHHQIYPPTANYLALDPDCDLDVVPNAAREGVMNIALSNSFAFGGLNAVLAFRRWV